MYTSLLNGCVYKNNFADISAANVSSTVFFFMENWEAWFSCTKTWRVRIWMKLLRRRSRRIPYFVIYNIYIYIYIYVHLYLYIYNICMYMWIYIFSYRGRGVEECLCWSLRRLVPANDAGMYSCMYLCMNVCMYAYMYAIASACIRLSDCACKCLCMYAFALLRVSPQVCIYAFMNVGLSCGEYFCVWYWYRVSTISRLLKIIGLFCKRALEKRLYSAKETYNFKEPTNHSQPICMHIIVGVGVWLWDCTRCVCVYSWECVCVRGLYPYVMQICVYACICLCMHVYVYILICIYEYVNMKTCTQGKHAAHFYIRIFIDVCMHICIFVLCNRRKILLSFPFSLALSLLLASSLSLPLSITQLLTPSCLLALSSMIVWYLQWLCEREYLFVCVLNQESRLWLVGSLKYRSLLQNIVSFIGLFLCAYWIKNRGYD